MHPFHDADASIFNQRDDRRMPSVALETYYNKDPTGRDRYPLWVSDYKYATLYLDLDHRLGSALLLWYTPA